MSRRVVRRYLAAIALLSLVALPAAADYGSAPELLEAMLKAQRGRAEGVSDYVMDIDLMNQPSTQFHERTSGDAAVGSSMELFRLVPQTEVRARLKKQGQDPGSRGLPGGRRGSSQETQDWASAGSELDPAEFMQRAKIVGRESIDGRSASVVRADGLGLRQISDGEEFTIESITIWIDVDNLVMLKMRMDGRMTEKGKSREIFIEKLDRDHRIVSGSRMILPYRSVMRMGGMLGPEQQKEMEQASTQLAELDQQMASMPASQRKMMESRMGPQIEMMRAMAEGGAMEIETVVREIRINQGLSGALARNTPGASGMVDMWKAPTPTLEQARQACLERKVAEAQGKKKKKKRFGKLFSAVGRIAGRHGGAELASDIGQVTSVAYEADATAKDLESAAEALGISQEDVAACQNPDSES